MVETICYENHILYLFLVFITTFRLTASVPNPKTIIQAFAFALSKILNLFTTFYAFFMTTFRTL